MTWWMKAVLFSVGFIVATGLEAARADEAYLCDKGRIVYVPLGKLDEMKRTDPCIAGYFGLRVETAPVTATKPKDAPATALETGAAAAPVAKPKPVLRPLKDSDLSAGRDAAPARVAARRGPPVAAEGTDYRNVSVLNGSGDTMHYRHDN